MKRKREIEKLRGTIKKIQIFDILEVVHDHTGFLDCFELVNPDYHGHLLSDGKRKTLAQVTLLALGMNVGLNGIANSIGKDHIFGQLRNFSENYLSIGNLESALRCLIQVWDLRGYGSPLGSGKSCSSDGKVMFSYLTNLKARFHYRKGKMGLTIYWFIRDDWLGINVLVIGNDEWESWYVLDGLMTAYCQELVKQSCGDTQAQLLALWGIGHLIGFDVRARFRRIKTVKLFKSGEDFSVSPLSGVEVIDWDLIKKCLPSLFRLSDAIQSGNLESKPYLSTWNFYDEDGNNLGDGLRELGKVSRTRFILRYLMDESLQQDLQAGCNRSEFWNNFHRAVFWGRGGVISTQDPIRQQVTALCLMLLMNSIVFYNKAELGLTMEECLGDIMASPVFWSHINFLGEYHIGLSGESK